MDVQEESLVVAAIWDAIGTGCTLTAGVTCHVTEYPQPSSLRHC
jgi:hypothetical protein